LEFALAFCFEEISDFWVVTSSFWLISTLY